MLVARNQSPHTAGSGRGKKVLLLSFDILPPALNSTNYVFCQIPVYKAADVSVLEALVRISARASQKDFMFLPGGDPRDLRLLERPSGYLLTGDRIANGINRWLARRGWGKFLACH